MRESAYRFVLFFALLFCVIQTSAQTRKELEQQRQELLQKISDAKKVLAATRKKQTSSITQLKAIGSQIKTRERIIVNVQSQIGVMDKQIRPFARFIGNACGAIGKA
jgi:septal ring factor EnvC (AmiA/AmiB activator)